MKCQSDLISTKKNKTITPVGNEVNAKYRVPMHPGKPGKLRNNFPGPEKSWKK